MLTLLLKRLATLVPTLLGVTLLAFALIRLIPGDPVEIMVGERRLDPAAHAALMQQLGLDQPLPVQYVRYVWQLLQGDLGQSLVTRESVAAEFKVLFPATLELAGTALALALALAPRWRWGWGLHWASRRGKFRPVCGQGDRGGFEAAYPPASERFGGLFNGRCPSRSRR